MTCGALRSPLMMEVAKWLGNGHYFVRTAARKCEQKRSHFRTRLEECTWIALVKLQVVATETLLFVTIC